MRPTRLLHVGVHDAGLEGGSDRRLPSFRTAQPSAEKRRVARDGTLLCSAALILMTPMCLLRSRVEAES